MAGSMFLRNISNLPGINTHARGPERVQIETLARVVMRQFDARPPDHPGRR